MLNNNYLAFGNSIMQKYSGMTSRINPLALIFLQKEEEEEQPQVRPAQITNIQNYYYRTNRYIYNNIVNRYVQNYNQIVSVLQSNTLYAGSPNFKMDIHPVQMNHMVVQTTEDMETVVKQITEHLVKEFVRVNEIHDKTIEVDIKKLAGNMPSDSLKVLPLKVRETILSKITEEIREKIIPNVQKQTDHTVLQKETTKLLQQSIQSVMQQNAGRLPEPVIAETASKLTKELSVWLTGELKTVSASVSTQISHNTEKLIEQNSEKLTERVTEKLSERSTEKLLGHSSEKLVEQKSEKLTENSREVISRILIRQIEPFIMSLSPGTSRAVIRQEIWKECRKEESINVLMRELEHWNETVEPKADTPEHKTNKTENKINTVVIRNVVQSLIQRIVEQTDNCRKGKERFERQVFNRLTPLPVRPLSLEFRTEKQETEDAATGQHPENRESRVMQQKVVQILKKEQTAESKYYTHFVKKFLKKTEEQLITEVDKRTLPAGIIYPQKPKETVRFVSRDVIKLPLQMLPQQYGNSGQDITALAQAGSVARKEQPGNAARKEQLGNAASGGQSANTDTNKVTNIVRNEFVKEVVHSTDIHNIDIFKEHTERRVIHRSIPKFTARQGASVDFGTMVYGSTEPAISYQTGTLELTFLVQDETGAVADIILQEEKKTAAAVAIHGGMQKQSIAAIREGMQKQSFAVIHEGMQEQSFAAIREGMQKQSIAVHPQMDRTSEIAPVELIHKREDNGKAEAKEEPSKGQSTTEVVQPDIIFTEEIVTKQNVENVITEQLQSQQQSMASGQSANIMTAGQVQGMMNHDFQELQADRMSEVKVEQMISESVSRHMDENIQEISRKVYRSLERQIRKEQERRGL